MAVRWEELDDDLRRLWRHAPLTPTKLERYTEHLVRLFGDSDPDWALEYLDLTIRRFMRDEEIGALAAVMGLHPRVVGRTIPERLSCYAEQYLPPRKDGRTRDTSTARRRAERGSEALAKRWVKDLFLDGRRNSIEVVISGSRDDLTVTVEGVLGDGDQAMIWTVLSHELPEWEEVDPSVRDPELPQVVLDDILADWAESGYQPEPSRMLRARGAVNPSGEMSLDIEWLDLEPPHVMWRVFVDWPCHVKSWSTNIGASIALWPPEHTARLALAGSA